MMFRALGSLQSAVYCVLVLCTVLFFLVLAPAAGGAARECGLGAETGGRGATSPGTLGLVTIQIVRGSRALGPVLCQCGLHALLQLAAGSGKVPGGLTSSGSDAWAWVWVWAWRGIHSACSSRAMRLRLRLRLR
jgi:hypothetical protein